MIKMVISNQDIYGKDCMTTIIYIPLRLAIDLDFVILEPLFKELAWDNDRKPWAISLRYENSIECSIPGMYV